MKEPLSPDAATQTPYQVRFDWGEAGLNSIAQEAEVIAIVDALDVVGSQVRSRLTRAAAEYTVPVIAVTLGNAGAAAQWLIRRQESRQARQRVAVIAAGEVRADGSLRFAMEDLLAAGAFVTACAHVGLDHSSPEAAAAAAAFEGLRPGLRHLLIASVTGQQLVASGDKEDIVRALVESVEVPVLAEGVVTPV